MRVRTAAIILLFMFCGSSLNAQEVKKPPETKIELGFGKNILRSNFKSPEKNNLSLLPAFSLGFSLDKPSGTIGSTIGYTYQNMPTITVSSNANYAVVKAGRTKTSLGLQYMYSLQKENVLNLKTIPLDIEGTVEKQSFLMRVSEQVRAGPVEFKFSFLAGGARFIQKENFFSNKRHLNAGKDCICLNLLFHKEFRPMAGLAGSIALATKHFEAGIDYERFRLLNNPTRLMPTEIYYSEASAAYFPARNFGLKVSGRYGNSEKEAPVLPTNLTGNLIFRF